MRPDVDVEVIFSDTEQTDEEMCQVLSILNRHMQQKDEERQLEEGYVACEKCGKPVLVEDYDNHFDFCAWRK